MYTLTIDKIYVGRKVLVNRNANFDSWQGFGISESYGWQECQLWKLTGFGSLEN